MPMDGKGKGGLMGLGSMGPPGADDDDAEPTGDAKTMAAKDLVSAVKGGDAGKVASAFQRMYDLCATSKDDDEYEE